MPTPPPPRPDFSGAKENMARFEIPGEVRIEIGYIGEGLYGNFQEALAADVPLLRFDAIDLTGRKRDIQDNSYCTAMPAWMAEDVLVSVCKKIAEEVKDKPHWKHTLESLSWLDEKEAHEIHTRAKSKP